MEALNHEKSNEQRTVTAAKEVKLALITYIDEFGVEITQPAMVGDNTVVLLNSKDFGITTREESRKGRASQWLTDGVLKILKGKKNGPK